MNSLTRYEPLIKACHGRGETRVRWSPRPDGLEESVQFTPGFNCPVSGGKGHGVHGMEIAWLLKGAAGAVQATFATNWIPGEVWPGHGLLPDGSRAWRNPGGDWSTDPQGYGIGIHSLHPQYEGHKADQCCLIDAPCYYAKHLSGADPLVPGFMAEGEQVVWDELEARYASLSEAAGGAL